MANRLSIGLIPKLFLTLFLLFFGVFGLGFIAFFAYTISGEIATLSWNQVPCRIESSSVLTPSHSNGDHYQFKVSYSYDAGGRRRQGAVLSKSYRHSDSYKKAAAHLKKFSAGAKTTCLVNPDNPNDSVLISDVPWVGVPFMIIPLIFMVIGFGGVFMVWRGGAGRDGEGGEPRSPPSTRESEGFLVRWGLAVFFSFFLVLGGAGTIAMLVIPVQTLIKAQDWEETPCRVISSRVAKHSGSEQTTYSVDIVYSYQVNGKTYRSDRYAASGGSSSGYDSKREVVSRYPKGGDAICFVNPDNPEEAILNRDFQLVMLFGLIPFLFFVIGLGGVGYVVKRNLSPTTTGRTRAATGGIDGMTATSPSDGRLGEFASSPGDGMLKSRSRLKNVFGVLFFAVFWNGIVSVFLFQVYKTWAKGDPDYFQTIFLLPFLLVGVGAIIGVFYTFMALFNPKVVLSLVPADVIPGDPTRIDWSLSRSPDRVNHLKIVLEGREEAIIHSGKNSHTHKSVFHRETLLDLENPAATPSGSTEINIPANSMHSFKSKHFGIIWELRVEGDIRLWPDIGDKHVLNVLPPRKAT